MDGADHLLNLRYGKQSIALNLNQNINS